jgi:predicted nucleic acid-binding protein
VTTYLLDTTALIDFLGGAPKAVSLVKELSEDEHELCTCCICVAELYSGLSGDAAATADELLDNLTYFDVTRDQARLGGSMRYHYARRGISLSTSDTIIAAVAIVNDATLVTANVRDFPMAELRLLELPSN